METELRDRNSWHFLKRLSRKWQWQEVFILILVAILAGLVWGFVELAEDVVRGEKHAFDEQIILALRNPADPSDPIGPHWVEELMRDLTALGGMGVCVFLTIASATFLALQGRGRTMVLLLVSIGGGYFISMLLKYGFSRPRPDLVPHDSYSYTSSFPSGHSTMAAVTYLTLAILLIRTQASRRIRLFLLASAVVVTVCVGISRVYLGVHWPTDVLAGWTLGAAWAILCWLAAHWLQRRGGVEPEAKDTAGET